jgi:KaiC/GvpD/RAD55 family RecA-like ATPase
MKEDTDTKVSSGVAKLDDLLNGGLPLNSNILLYGPNYTGKRVLLDIFVLDGLGNDIPCIYILTDKTVKKAIESMELINPSVNDFIEKGLLTFVDIFSRSMGISTTEQNTHYVDEPTNLNELTTTVKQLQESFEKKYDYYKLAFSNITALTPYTDSIMGYRFQNQITNSCSMTNGVGMYLLNQGIHRESEINTYRQLYSGVINTVHMDLKLYLRMEGTFKVQSKDYIEYTHDSKSFTLIGSASAQHIKW